MKHFDVEAYAKTMLGDMVMAPEEDVWQEISESLDKQQIRKRIKLQCIKIAMIMLFLFAIPGQIEKSNANLAAVQKQSTTKVAHSLSTDSPIHKDVVIHSELSSSIVDMDNKSYKRVDRPKVEDRQAQPVSAKRPQINMSRNDGVHEQEKRFEELKKTGHTIVTDTEIDSLIEKARQNLEMERALQREREAFANEMLAEIKKETETKNQGFYHDIKRGYSKLKTVLSN